MASRKGVNQLSAATTLSTNFGKFSTFTYVRPAYNFYGYDRSSNDLLTETRYLDSEETFKSRENTIGREDPPMLNLIRISFMH